MNPNPLSTRNVRIVPFTNHLLARMRSIARPVRMSAGNFNGNPCSATTRVHGEPGRTPCRPCGRGGVSQGVRSSRTPFSRPRTRWRSRQDSDRRPSAQKAEGNRSPTAQFGRIPPVYAALANSAVSDPYRIDYLPTISKRRQVIVAGWGNGPDGGGTVRARVFAEQLLQHAQPRPRAAYQHAPTPNSSSTRTRNC